MLRSLRVRLLLLVLLPLVPVLVAGLFHALEARREGHARVERDTQQVATLLAEAQAARLDSARRLLEALSSLPAVTSGEPATCDAILAPLAGPSSSLTVVAVVEADGAVRCGAPAPLPPRIEEAPRWLEEAMKGGGPVVSPFRLGSLTGRPVQVVARRVQGPDGRARVLFASLDLAWLGRIVASAGLPPSSEVRVIDAEDRVMARHPGAATRADGEGSAPAGPGTDEARIHASAPLPGEHPEARVELTLPARLAFAEADRATGRGLIVLAVAVIVAGLATAGLRRLFTDRLVRLVRSVRRILEGQELQPLGPPYAPDELGELARAFDLGAAELAARTRETARAERRWRAVFEGVPDAVLVLDGEGRVEACNPAALAIAAREPPAMLGVAASAFFDEGDRAAVDLARARAVEGHRGALPARVRQPAGELRFVDIRLVPFEDPHDGPPGALLLAEDVTRERQAVAALERSEARYQQIVDTAQEGIWVYDHEGRTRYVNRRMAELVGTPVEELEHARLLDFVDPEDTAVIERRLAERARGERGRYDLRLKRRGGESLWVHVSATPLVGEDGQVVGGLKMVTDITERVRTAEDLQATTAQLRALTGKLETVREEERTRIAREVHDELGQSLTALKMDIAWVGRRLPGPAAGETEGAPVATALLPEDAQALRKRTVAMSALVDRTINTVRRIATALRPLLLDDLGLTEAVEWQVQEFESRTGIPCSLSIEPVQIDRGRATAVFRILQEILTNVARHAAASTVEVSMRASGDVLTLTVVDDGRGITAEEVGRRTSLGLMGMRERAALVGGTLRVSGAPDAGTTVELEMPLGAEERRA